MTTERKEMQNRGHETDSCLNSNVSVDISDSADFAKEVAVDGMFHSSRSRVSTDIARPIHLAEAFETLLTECAAWYWQQDSDFRFTRFIGKAVSEFQVNEICIGKARWEISALIPSGQFGWDDHRKTLESRQAFSGLEILFIRPNRTSRWYGVSGTPIFDERHNFVGYHGVGIDIHAKKVAEGQIVKLSRRDELTGIGNRKCLFENLKLSKITGEKSSKHFALLHIDIDHFRQINYTHGHSVGDAILCAVGQRLSSMFNESTSAICRLGGDEFFVLVNLRASAPSDACIDEVSEQARKIQRMLSLPFKTDEGFVSCTTSIGIAMFGTQSLSADGVFKSAEIAMYDAKAAGRSGFVVYEPGQEERASTRTQLERDLFNATTSGQMRVFYQPQADAAGTVVGYEALVRWQHPVRGLLTPGIFISMAEKNGLIVPIGQWVLTEACRKLAKWSADASRTNLTIAVNLSARQVNHPNLLESIVKILKETNAPGNRIKLEITESVLLNDSEETVLKLKGIASLGIRISLDDFGTGYSSLSYLKRLPLSQLKIDKSFVTDLLNDQNDRAIAKAVIGLARSLNMGVIAEGVERKEQLNALIDMGCDTFQGYFFGAPATLET